MSNKGTSKIPYDIAQRQVLHTLKILAECLSYAREGGSCLEYSYLTQIHRNGHRRMRLWILNMGTHSWTLRNLINKTLLLPSWALCHLNIYIYTPRNQNMNRLTVYHWWSQNRKCNLDMWSDWAFYQLPRIEFIQAKGRAAANLLRGQPTRKRRASTACWIHSPVSLGRFLPSGRSEWQKVVRILMGLKWGLCKFLHIHIYICVHMYTYLYTFIRM